MQTLTAGLLSGAALAQGGPPMITDDPGTPGNHKWEINMAAISQATNGQNVTQAPYFDLNYGWGDHLQLKYESGLTSVPSQTMPIGGSQATAGVKWRFLDEENTGFDLSTYPQYQFSPSYIGNSSAAAGTNFFLPISLSKKIGNFIINPEIGYSFEYNNGFNFWTAGFLLAQEYKNAELMAEVFSQFPNLGGNQNLLLFNFGGRYNFNETITAIGSVGTSLITPLGSPAMSFAYCGLQFHL